jgi:hypothetical protein
MEIVLVNIYIYIYETTSYFPQETPLFDLALNIPATLHDFSHITTFSEFVNYSADLAS